MPLPFSKAKLLAAYFTSKPAASASRSHQEISAKLSPKEDLPLYLIRDALGFERISEAGPQFSAEEINGFILEIIRRVDDGEANIFPFELAHLNKLIGEMISLEVNNGKAFDGHQTLVSKLSDLENRLQRATLEEFIKQNITPYYKAMVAIWYRHITAEPGQANEKQCKDLLQIQFVNLFNHLTSAECGYPIYLLSHANVIAKHDESDKCTYKIGKLILLRSIIPLLVQPHYLNTIFANQEVDPKKDIAPKILLSIKKTMLSILVKPLKELVTGVPNAAKAFSSDRLLFQNIYKFASDNHDEFHSVLLTLGNCEIEATAYPTISVAQKAHLMDVKKMLTAIEDTTKPEALREQLQISLAAGDFETAKQALPQMSQQQHKTAGSMSGTGIYSRPVYTGIQGADSLKPPEGMMAELMGKLEATP